MPDSLHAESPPAADSGRPTVQRFRKALARYATGIAVVTTVAAGQDHAMTANSFTSVSLEPLLALVCVERDSRFHEAVRAAGFWSVSFLPAGRADQARWFATRGRALEGQFDNYPHHRGENGAVLLDDALAALELTTVQSVVAGDHDILIASVDVIHDPTDQAGPTVYYASHYSSLPSMGLPSVGLPSMGLSALE